MCPPRPRWQRGERVDSTLWLRPPPGCSHCSTSANDGRTMRFVASVRAKKLEATLNHPSIVDAHLGEPESAHDNDWH